MSTPSDIASESSLDIETLSLAPSVPVQSTDQTSLPDPAKPTSGPTISDGPLGERARTEIPLARQRAMFATLEAVFERAEEAEGGVGVSELRSWAVEDDGFEDLSDVSRVDSLKRVKDILYQMWSSGSDFLTRAAEVLADGSRDPEWRLPFGESGVLRFFLAVIATPQVERELLLHSLRLVGNSCADTNENRERVMTQVYVSSILSYLSNPQIIHVVVPVLYNICMDYEPAQQKVATDGLVSRLVELISAEMFIDRNGKALLSYVCRLMELVVAQPQAIEASPDNAAEVLFQVALDPSTELEEFLILIKAAMVHLSAVRCQQHLISNQSLKLALSALVRSYSPPSTPTDANASAETPLPAEDQKLLSDLRHGLIHVISDISALPDFKETYPLDSPLIGSLRMWLTLPQSHLRLCACIMLGNLARSDDVCWIMVHDFEVHRSLIKIIQDCDDVQVLHGATGFLKNLSLMVDNKGVLGSSGLIEALARLWSKETSPQIQYAGASLARQVISGSFANIKRLLTPLSMDPDSPAHARTYLSLLLLLCEKSDQAPTKTEVARTVTAVCRALNSPQPTSTPQEMDDLQHRLYELHPDVAWPLMTMTCQNKWPVVRSEGWFAFALMARSKEGSVPVSEVMTNVEVLKPLIEVVTGRSIVGTPVAEDNPTKDPLGGEISVEEQAKISEMKRMDRENALVLISKLLEHRGEDMSVMRRQLFEDLMHGKELETWDATQLEAVSRKPEAIEAMVNSPADT